MMTSTGMGAIQWGIRTKRIRKPFTFSGASQYTVWKHAHPVSIQAHRQHETLGVGVTATLLHHLNIVLVAMDTTDSHERDIDVEPMLKRQREDSSQKTDTQDDTAGQPDSPEARDREPSPAMAEAHKRIEEFTQKDP
ncbi:unnamed protein product [Closterium sp. Yama58-4]|nr:unnamed protein product [Closterium sp. Yama58-4]